MVPSWRKVLVLKAQTRSFLTRPTLCIVGHKPPITSLHCVTCWVCVGCCCVCVQVVFAAQKRNLPSDFQAQKGRRRWSPVGRGKPFTIKGAKAHIYCSSGDKVVATVEWKESLRKRAKKEERLTAKASSALWLSVVSSGLSTGVCRVNLVSNWLTSSSDCCSGTRQGEDEEFNLYVYYWGSPFVKIHRCQATLPEFPYKKNKLLNQQLYKTFFKRIFNFDVKVFKRMQL